MQDSLNPFTIAQQQLDDAAQKLGLEPAMHELLRWPMQELKVLLGSLPSLNLLRLNHQRLLLEIIYFHGCKHRHLLLRLNRVLKRAALFVLLMTLVDAQVTVKLVLVAALGPTTLPHL